MRFKFIQPSGSLSQYIKHYWILESDPFEEEVCERVIPTDSIQLMFHYKNPFVVKQSETNYIQQPKSILSGLSKSFFDVSTQGESGVIAVVFYPYGACNFFGFPLKEIENLSIHLDDVYANEIRMVEERICEVDSIKNRISIIEDFLLSKIQPIPLHDFNLIRNGISIILKESGQINAEQLADKLMISPKSLERKFNSYIGKSPKQYIRIVRFQEVVNGFSRFDNSFLTSYAYNNGYYDQSHFIRDFKTLSGYTPTEFLKRCCREQVPINSIQ